MLKLFLVVALSSAPDAGTPATVEDVAATFSASPEARAAAVSINLCVARQDEAKALESIREEKENSKIAGVVDLRILKLEQDRVVEARKLIKEYRAILQQMKRKALPCDSEVLEALWACASNPELCPGTDAEAFRRLVSEVRVVP